MFAMSYPQQPWGTPQGWPPQPPPPPKPAQSHAVTALAALGAIVVTCAVCGLFGRSGERSGADGGAPATQRTVAPGATPNAELTQTVLYRSRIGFQVCARRALHECTMTFVSSAGLDMGTIRIGPLDIGPADRCESIGATAAERCGDAGVDPFHELPSGRGHGPTMEWIACAARYGFIYRGGPNTVAVDPRDEDPHARPGHARLQCAEGFKRAAFDNTL